MAIPDAGLSHKSSMSFAKEATPGTVATAADVKMELISASLKPGVSTIRSRSMNPTGGTPRYIGRGPQQPRIHFVAQGNYQGLEHLWRAALSTYSNAIVSGTTRDHTFKEGADPLTYSVDLSAGDIPTGKVMQMIGGRLIELTARCDTGGIMEVEGEWAGISLLENITPMTPATIGAVDGIQWDHAVAANIFDGSGVAPANIPITKFEISMKLPHKTDRMYFGSTNPARPLRTENYDFSWMFDLEFGDDDLMTKARGDAAAAGGLELLFRGAAITGGFYELSLKASSPHSADFGVEVPNFDITTQSVTWALAYNTTDSSALVVRTRSANGALA